MSEEVKKLKDRINCQVKYLKQSREYTDRLEKQLEYYSSNHLLDLINELKENLKSNSELSNSGVIIAYGILDLLYEKYKNEKEYKEK